MLFLRAHDLHIAKKLRKNEAKAGRSSDAGTTIVTPRKRKNDVLPSQIPITTTAVNFSSPNVFPAFFKLTNVF
ncbi:hypothetical protein MCOR23_006753 [Pyricularia oryzae]|nr:hypothetical protein MCOR23_006753 [Pyricularia oryzae]